MRRLGSIALIVAQFGFGLPAVAATEAPRAVFPVTSHDFGTVQQGEKVVRDFPLRNQGTAPLTIEGGDLSMPGMKARFQRVIGPGEETKITLEWDTSSVTGEVRAEAVFRLNDPSESKLTLTLKGVAKPPIEIHPLPAVFFSVWKGESVERSVTVVNNEERPLRILGLEQDGKHFSASFQTVEPGKVYNLVVNVPPDTPPGRYMEAVYVKTDHPKLSRVRIGVNVFVKAELYADPQAVDFGRVSLDRLARAPAVLELATQTIMVKKRQGEFEIKSIASDVPLLKITQTPDGGSQIYRIDVGLVRDRLRAGKFAGSIRILTSDKEFPELVIPVRGEVR